MIPPVIGLGCNVHNQRAVFDFPLLRLIEPLHHYAEMLERYRIIAGNYAVMENAVAVLSDLRNNVSYIYYGRTS